MTVKNEKEMHDLIIQIDYTYLIGLKSKDRTELCKNLVEEIKKFPQYSIPNCWLDCIKNPGVWNERAFRELGTIGE